MVEDLPDLLQAVAELARLTGAKALQYYRGELTVERKADGSPVSIADREAERLARDWIARRFPRDAILGEELGHSGDPERRCWLLDPVDGTRSFVRGVPLWGSLVAVVEGGRVLAGAAAFPAVGEHLSAAPGLGCWHNNSRCRVSDIAQVADATVLTTDEPSFDAASARGWQALTRAAGMARGWGDCYGYLLVATGRAEVMVDARLNPWDSSCFVPIIAEAGGAISQLDGHTPWNLANAIATNSALAEAAREFFR